MKRIGVLLFSLIIGVTCLTSCKSNEAFTEKRYISGSKEISSIFIDAQDREIEVMLSPDDQIYIDYFQNSKEYYDISVSDKQILTMTSVEDKIWIDYIGSEDAIASRKILLQVPDALLTSLKLSTTNEDILLPIITVSGDISLSSQGGNIIFEKLDAGNAITLTSKNADIKGLIIGSYDDYAIFCDTKKGKSNLPPSKNGGEKTLTVSNNNGDIDIEFVRE